MLRRLYEPQVYDPAPVPSHWEATVARPDVAALVADTTAEVAIIGGGYTGLSAALHLAQRGVDVALLDAAQPGWGASGRNGGFCCLGGSAMPRGAQIKRFGQDGADALLRLQAGAIGRVERLVSEHGLDVDAQPGGEICLAHRPSEMAGLEDEAALLNDVLGVDARVLPRDALADQGLGMAGAHGALHLPLGFGLHPLKYALGLARAAERAGARLFGDSTVTAISRDADRWRLRTAQGDLSAKKVIVATNGYSAEALPDWLGGRFLPVLSNIMVTRPLTGAELQAQGWTSQIMSYDSRTLLHYFRLLPDNRLLLGMRGNVRAGGGPEQRHRAAMRKHFEAMFPAWRHVETDHVWSGLVCMTLDRLSYIGPVPGMAGVFTGLGWHGNGVAMATEAGARLADLATGCDWHSTVPAAARAPLRRFPMARYRRAVLPLAYSWYRLTDGAGP